MVLPMSLMADYLLQIGDCAKALKTRRGGRGDNNLLRDAQSKKTQLGRLFRFGDYVAVRGIRRFRDKGPGILRLGRVICERIDAYYEEQSDANRRLKLPRKILYCFEPKVLVLLLDTGRPVYHRRHMVDLTASEQVARLHRRVFLDPAQGPSYKFISGDWVRIIPMPMLRTLRRIRTLGGVKPVRSFDHDSCQMALVSDAVRAPTSTVTNWYCLDCI